MSTGEHQRGVALLLVLWVLALLSLLLGGLAGWVQLQTRQALWHREYTHALFSAEAGVTLAVQGLSDPRQRNHLIADGRAIELGYEGARLQVSVRSERGKVDMNSAGVGDIIRVAQAYGASKDQAARLAQAVTSLRISGATPLRVIEEVRQLPGMTQALYMHMLPEMTLWSGLDRPEPAFASAQVRQALSLPNQSALGADPGDVLVITSRAERPTGIHAELQTTVLLSPSEGSAQPYRVLRWQE